MPRRARRSPATSPPFRPTSPPWRANRGWKPWAICSKWRGWKPKAPIAPTAAARADVFDYTHNKPPKPNVIPRKLDEEKQKAFIESYEKLLNSLGDDEAVLFADAVHPTHAARPVGCWAPSQEKLAIEQTSGRQRINIHGAIDLATGQTRMIEALTIDAASTIRLLQSIETLYPMLALIHVFLDNARYHHAKLVQEWLALPGRRIKLHFIPSYCPHLNPIERLWGLMHRNVTHNKCYATCAQFADATLSFLREKVPGNWANLCDSVTDNFRIINPKDFRVVA